MNLDMSNWKEFRFGDLISDIYKAKAINKDDLTVSTDFNNAIRYITRTGENNGCELLADVRDIDSRIIEKGNAISIGDTTATCFYQEESFIAGDHMVVIRADSWLNPYTALYIVAILTNEQYKYSYGRAYLIDRIKDTVIKLPTNSDDIPDWLFVENYIKSLHHKPLTTKNKTGTATKLKVQTWKDFFVEDLFDIHPTKALEGVNSEECAGHGVPLVVNQSNNNGVAGMCDYPPTESGGIITFSDTWEGETFFYQPKGFIGFAHVQGMYPKVKNLSGECLLFMATVLEFVARGRYSYGRKKRRDIIQKEIIKLPATEDGTPDWQFMENYIKSLPYGDKI